MTQTTETSSLVAAYHAATSKQKTAQRIIMIAIVLTVAAFIWMIWNSFTTFRDEGMPEFGAALSAEASEFMPTALEEVNAMANRLTPVYLDSFSSVFNRDEAAYHELLNSEFEKLDAYAKGVWPEMEQAIAQLVIDQETALNAALSEKLTVEDMAVLTDSYRVALEAHLAEVFANEFEEQVATGVSIISKLEAMAVSPTTETYTDTQFIMGMLIELLGIQMQDASSVETPSTLTSL